MSTQAIPYIILLGFLYGSTLVVSRFSVGQYDPTTYIGIRLVLASLAHVAFYLFSTSRRWPTDRTLWKNAALIGVTGTAIPMVTTVSSLQFQSAGLTSIMITASPAVTVLLAHFLLTDERLNRGKVFGVVLALAGALLLALRGETGLPDLAVTNPLGYILVATGIIFSSGTTVYIRRNMRNFDSFDVATVRMITAALTVMPLSAMLIGIDLSRVTATGYVALGYAALSGTFSGMLLGFYITKRFGATAMAMSAYTLPVFANLGGVLLLSETITSGMLVGLGLIGLGIFIINRRQ